MKQYFVAPQQLQVKQDVLEQLDAAGVEYEVCCDLDQVIPEADAIYMTRIQDEWDQTPGESGSIDTGKYHFTEEHLAALKQQAVIMHPLPRRQEIDPAVDSDTRAVYWRQVRNGMWIRVALIATIFGVGDTIRNYYHLNL